MYRMRTAGQGKGLLRPGILAPRKIKRLSFSQANDMDHKLYNQYMHEYLKAALENGHSKPVEIAQYLDVIPLPGRFTRNKEERVRALRAVRQAFNEHRHWPLDIILSHLGIDPEKEKSG
jgi:hypothetical protein